MKIHLTEAEQYALLKCLKRLVYSKDVITKEDKDVLLIIDRECTKIKNSNSETGLLKNVNEVK